MAGEQPSASERALAAARSSLRRLTPEYSAHRQLTFVQTGVLFALIALLVAAVMASPDLSIAALSLIAAIIFIILVIWRFIAAFAAMSLKPPEPKAKWTATLPLYTILCPLYREARVLPALAERLARLDYPADKLDVKLVLEADDVETIEAANAIAWPAHYEIIVAPRGHPRTKPKALNYALTFARGAFVTVYDAEDEPHPSQLRIALNAFASGGDDLGCVQAPLLFDNGDASWLAGQFAAEYAIQFGEILPLLARLKLPLMLGGTSNHFRMHALIGSGGWDPHNVTEDADIGYRLAREGWRMSMIAPPTWEEAPATLPAWLKQRRRWIKGHMQTWAVLMREPSRTIREMGFWPFASMQLILGGGILAAFAHGPLQALLVWTALDAGISLAPSMWVLALSGYVVAIYNVAAAAWMQRDWRMGFTALTMPFYWPLASIAAAFALLSFVFRPHFWAKTEHGLTPRPDHAPQAP